MNKALALMFIYTMVMRKDKTSNAVENLKASGKTLPVLRAASDQNLLFALAAMKESGEYKEELPSYEAIAAEIKSQGRPELNNVQISRCIIRLRRFGYIVTRKSDELVGIPA